MVLFNYSTKELTAKVVYYGPGLCGKTTNLQWIHEKLPIKNKGKMLSLATETDRTLFFDFLPIEIGTIRGMRTRIQLYTVPGQVFYNATRRMVLKGADAVVFVCDSQEAMLDANLESYENMRQNLEANEIDPDEIPLVLQYNKRDLPNALPIEILNERLNPRDFPCQEAVALKGVGVEETLKAVTKLVFRSLSARYGEGAAPGARPAPARQASGPPLALSGPALPLSGPPLPPAGDDVLSELAPPSGYTPGPSRMTPLPPPAGSLPPIELESTPPPRDAVRPTPQPGAARLAVTSPPSAPPVAPRQNPGLPSRPPVPLAQPRTGPEVPTRPPVPPEPPPRAPVGSHPPQRTLITRRDEADDLRRHIATPSIPDDVEMDLEELDELEAVPAAPARRGSPRAAAVTAPDAVLEPEPDVETSEVEVPIDIEVAPGTTRLSLNLKLLLSFKRR
jgi:signal recognition particle receptor subunit beta